MSRVNERAFLPFFFILFSSAISSVLVYLIQNCIGVTLLSGRRWRIGDEPEEKMAVEM